MGVIQPVNCQPFECYDKRLLILKEIDVKVMALI